MADVRLRLRLKTLIYSESTLWEMRALFCIGLHGFADPRFPRKSSLYAMRCHENRQHLLKFEANSAWHRQSELWSKEGPAANSVRYVAACLSHTELKTLNLKVLLPWGIDFEILGLDGFYLESAFVVEHDGSVVGIGITCGNITVKHSLVFVKFSLA